MEDAMDPAVVDRATTALAGIDEAHLPVRTMSIAGLEGNLTVRILSKDMTGPATRIVRFGAGWGSGVAGAFNADVSLFVVKGSVRVGDDVVGRYGLAHMPRRCVVPGLRAEPGTIGLLFTAAPVFYDTTSGGIAGRVELVDTQRIEWEPQPEQGGRFVKPILSSPNDTFWLGGSLEWSAATDPWHRHPTGEEAFVLEGEATIAEILDGEPSHHVYRPGCYLWRPAGTLHAGPGSSAADTLVAIHHATGRLETEWVADPEVASGEDGPSAGDE